MTLDTNFNPNNETIGATNEWLTKFAQAFQALTDALNYKQDSGKISSILFNKIPITTSLPNGTVFLGEDNLLYISTNGFNVPVGNSGSPPVEKNSIATVYLDVVNGLDSSSGVSEDTPVKSMARALEVANASFNGEKGSIVSNPKSNQSGILSEDFTLPANIDLDLDNVKIENAIMSLEMNSDLVNRKQIINIRSASNLTTRLLPSSTNAKLPCRAYMNFYSLKDCDFEFSAAFQEGSSSDLLLTTALYQPKTTGKNFFNASPVKHSVSFHAEKITQYTPLFEEKEFNFNFMFLQ